MSKLKSTGLFLLVFVAYFAAAKFGLRFASLEANATPVWPPAGIAVAVLLILGYRYWPALFLSAFFVNLTTAGTLGTSLGIAVGNTLEALVAAYLIMRFADGMQVFSRTDNVFKFAVFGGISAFVSATAGVTALWLGGLIAGTNYLAVWTTWWLGDASGILIVAPLVIAWFTDHSIAWDVRKILEGLALVTLLFVFALFAFKSASSFVFLFYLFIPVFVWVAFRFTQLETATVLFAMTEISIWETLRGTGPFFNIAGTLNNELLLLEATMSMIAVTMLALSAASVREREYVTGIGLANERMVQEKAVDAAIFASMGDGLIVTDRDDRIVLVNPQAERLLGRSDDEMVGKKYFEAVPMQDEKGDVVASHDRPLGLAVAGRERKTSSGLAEDAHYYVRKDGSRFPVAFTNTPVILDGKAIGAIDIFRDASSAREIDRSKSEFVSLAAHQLRTPLSVIAMHAELMKKQDQLFAGHDERLCADYASEIHSVAMRMADLINDLLNVSRIDTRTLVVTPSAVDLRRTMEGILREVAIKFENKDITVETSYPDPEPEFVTDPHLLEIVVENLLGNAFKYTPEGGRVSVKVADAPQEIVITVTDTGQGIPHAQHGEVFKKFFRAANARKIASEGTGLGLYIAKSIVERLGGDISFNSKEGEGTTFIVRLPKEDTSRPADERAEERGMQEAGEKRRFGDPERFEPSVFPSHA